MRIYDPRLGRFLSVDPITDEYPELTPYQFASNTPIQAIDLDGLEQYRITDSYLGRDQKAIMYDPYKPKVDNNVIYQKVHGFTDGNYKDFPDDKRATKAKEMEASFQSDKNKDVFDGRYAFPIDVPDVLPPPSSSIEVKPKKNPSKEKFIAIVEKDKSKEIKPKNIIGKTFNLNQDYVGFNAEYETYTSASKFSSDSPKADLFKREKGKGFKQLVKDLADNKIKSFNYVLILNSKNGSDIYRYRTALDRLQADLKKNGVEMTYNLRVMNVPNAPEPNVTVTKR
jgi:uncharacterized protein RhaS with RHS repeats